MTRRFGPMNRLIAVWSALAIVTATLTPSTAYPQLLSPLNNSIEVGAGFIQLDWTDECDVAAVPRGLSTDACWYAVQIARDASFANDTLELFDFTPAVISRFVVASALPPGTWFWRVASLHTIRPRISQNLTINYGPSFRFVVQPPAKLFSVSADATLGTIGATMAEAVAASLSTPVRVQFPERAQFRLDVGTAVVFLNLTGARDMVVDGRGSSFVFADGFLTFVWATNATRCTVMNLTVDFDPLPYTALRVLDHAGSGGARSLLAELAPGHPTIESNSKLAAYGIAEILNGSTLAVQRGAGLVLPFQWARVPGASPPQYNLSIETTDPKVWAAPGDVIAIDPRIEIGFGIYGSEQFTLAGLTVRSMSNEGFTSSYTNGLAILNCTLELLPGRYLAANNGGHNHHSARVGVWLEGGSWANTGDDFFNANCLMADLVGALNATSLLLKPSRYDPHGLNTSDIDMRVGDQLEVFDFANGTLLVNSTIVAVQTGIGSEPPLSTAVTVAGAIPAGIAQVPGLQAYNRQRTASQMVVRRVHLVNARRVGVLAHGVRGWVSDNVFSMLGGGLFEAWPDPAEGLGVESFVIESNVAEHTNQLDRWSAPIWMTSFSRNASIVHRDVWVLNNTILEGPGAAAVIQDVDVVRFGWNIFTLCETQTEPVSATFASNVDFSVSNIVRSSADPSVCIKPTGPPQ